MSEGGASFDCLNRRSFSRILEITGRRLIGLYDVTSVGVFPDLRIIMTFACFRGFWPVFQSGYCI
jgi:hypothetical protein